jgi:hypothetical protein
LFTRLGYTSAQQAIDLLSCTYPPAQLLPRHHYIAAATHRHTDRDLSHEPPHAPRARSSRPSDPPGIDC